MDAGIALIVGLGNPGERYMETRHNAGFRFLATAAGKFGVEMRRESRFKADIGRYDGGAHRVWLMMPQTFMNLSGAAVAPFVRYYKIEPAHLLVAYDDVDLPPGTVRLKRGGGEGGHNGLRDIVQKLGSAEFMRLRIGVGHPGSSDEVPDYVLRRAPTNEQALTDAAIDEALRHLADIVAGHYQLVMNSLHRKNDEASATSKPAG
ncbi:MAG: aminoacyl-tRNA hydrolase [Gammaproteobacteria bacterium]|nr:aminoacyl-tRNA hydrolase [Gammaproteobacteria bacterium]